MDETTRILTEIQINIAKSLGGVNERLGRVETRQAEHGNRLARIERKIDNGNGNGNGHKSAISLEKYARRGVVVSVLLLGVLELGFLLVRGVILKW